MGKRVDVSLKSISIVALSVVLAIGVSACGSKNTETVAVATVAPTASVAPTPTPAPVFKLNDKVTAGKFAVTASDTKVTSELKSTYTSEKTQDQFVVVKVAITNNDDRARDVSTSMFKLTDGNGKNYEAFDKSVGVDGDEFLFYETINPGLTRERSVAFETPKGISGLKLVVDSGVALAGGEKVAIDLGQ
jgi:hypothetical protein